MVAEPKAAFGLERVDDTIALMQMGRKGTPVSAKAFFTALADEIAPRSDLLPPVVRWCSESRRHWLFERPPGYQSISHHNLKPEKITAESASVTYDIPLPWTAYLVDLDSTYYPERIFVYALAHSIESLDDLIGVLPLANFYSSGRMCQPYRAEVDVNPQSIGEALNLAYQIVWSSGFNLDLSSGPAWSGALNRPAAIFNKLDMGAKRVASILRTWAGLSLEEVAAIDDWALPRNFDRDVEEETSEAVMAYAQGVRAGSKLYLRHALSNCEAFDHSRRGEWDSRSALLSLSGVIAKASLYD